MSQCEAVPEELVESAARLKQFMVAFSHHFGRKEMREHGEDFIEGLLSDLERKSVEPIAERAGKDRRGLQRFIGQGGWDHRPVLDELCEQVAREIGTPEGIFVLDPSTFVKQGKNSVGVKRQYCGQTGGIENCQKGVFLGYVSPMGRTLVDERLFLPEEWGLDHERREQCHVPKDVRHQTTCDLGLEMVLKRSSVLPHAWVVGDDEFGHNADLRVDLHRAKERYLLDVPSSTTVCDAQQAREEPRLTYLGFTQVGKWVDTVPK
ncbi:MAG: IS701 family transposase, partial [Elusimicrobiota bacterium]